MNDKMILRTILLACLFLTFFPRAYSDTRFLSAGRDYVLEFPRDDGSHHNYRTEWWYYTGQLWTEGRAPFEGPADFGFQLTFFRRGETSVHLDPRWNDSYLAHAAISPLGPAAEPARRAELVARGGLGLAGAAADRLKIWNHLWSVTDIAGIHILQFTVPEKNGEWSAEFRIDAREVPLMFHGEKGFSKKEEGGEGAASHYYSRPGMPLEGLLVFPDRVQRVSGISWMDHEFMTNALTADQQGWDWLSLMRRDGLRLMLFRVRGNSHKASYWTGTARQNGQDRTLNEADFKFEETDYWQSPESKGRYPIKWRLSVPSLALDTTVRARRNDQEFVPPAGSPVPPYWEGAVSDDANSVVGYLEMTGYAGKIGGSL